MSALYVKPDIQIIQELMIQRVTTHWRSIGTELLTKKYDTSKLGNIKESNPNNHEQCCREMFDHWLDKYENATWNDLLKALRSTAVGLNAVASDVEKEIKSRYRQGTLSHDQKTSPESQTKQPTVSDAADVGKQPTQDPDNKANGKDEPDDGDEATKPTGCDDTDMGKQPTQDETINFNDGVSSGPRTYPPSKVKNFEMREYAVMDEKKPAFAIIINNEEFSQSARRTGTEKDEQNIYSLNDFKGIKFHEHTLTNLKGDEMKGAFKILAKHDVTEEYLSDTEIDGALKLHCPPDPKLALLPAKSKRDILKKMAPIDFTKYNCFMAFIMSHGGKQGIKGTDETHVEVDTLSSYISKCAGLKDKPKIFFIQACRGNKKRDEVTKLDGSSYPASTDDKTPKEADFLYVYATPEDYEAGRSDTAGTLFILTLVEVMKETLDCFHLEEILLFVKNDMGKKTLLVEDEEGKRYHCKQIVSVVSQLRGRVFFC